MTRKQGHKLLDKIVEGMKEAIAELYENARKNRTELVVSDKNGNVKKIKIK